MCLQFFKRDELDRGRVRRFEVHWRRDAAGERFLPARDAETPFISGFQTRKSPFRMGRDKIVSLKDRVIEKFARHFYANRVQTRILRASATISITKKSCHRIATTAAEFGPKNVRQHER